MHLLCMVDVFFFFKQKTAYEMRSSDWSSDVCSSDLAPLGLAGGAAGEGDQTHIVDGRVARRKLGRLAFGNIFQRIGAAVVKITQIGRASCRERVCQYVYISVVAVSLKKKVQ